MNTNRRSFFKIAGVAGVGIFSEALSSCKSKENKNQTGSLLHIEEAANRVHSQRLNMNGYADCMMLENCCYDFF